MITTKDTKARKVRTLAMFRRTSTAAPMKANFAKGIQSLFIQVVYGQSLYPKSIAAHSDLSLPLEISEKRARVATGPVGGSALR